VINARLFGKRQPLLLLNVPDSEGQWESGTRSTFNMMHVNVVFHLVMQILGEGAGHVSAEDILILTPYEAQYERLLSAREHVKETH
jgi:hypothetical protein